MPVMSNNNDPFEELKRLIRENPDQITILEEEIDVKLQMEYYRAAHRAKSQAEQHTTEALSDELFDEEVTLKRKKKVLTLLASINEVPALRAIERFKDKPDSGLEHWSVMAFQESKMLISSQLIGGVPVFISTGLGGKDRSLRYSVALGGITDEYFTDFQIKIIRSEVEYVLKKSNSVLEEFGVLNNMAVLTVLIPIELDVRAILRECIGSANQFGSFLNETFVITNMRKINFDTVEADFKKSDEDFEEHSDFNEIDLNDNDEDDEE